MNDSEDPIFEASAEADPELARWVAALAERLLEGDKIEFDALAAADSEQADELARILPTIQRMVSFGKAMAESRGATHRGDRETRATELGTLGDFRLLREIGRGGMGIVYEAEQLSLQRRVALKILPLAAALDHRQYQRFLIEARASACLHHTNVVPVYAVGSERGVPYHAMQFIDGLTLAQALEGV